jgi:hypothetical protein
MGLMDEFEHDADRAARALLPRLRRFAEGYLSALLVSLASAGVHTWTWAALWSLAAGAAVTVAGELWPTVPWRRLVSLVERHLTHRPDGGNAPDVPPASQARP